MKQIFRKVNNVNVLIRLIRVLATILYHEFPICPENTITLNLSTKVLITVGKSFH